MTDPKPCCCCHDPLDLLAPRCEWCEMEMAALPPTAPPCEDDDRPNWAGLGDPRAWGTVSDGYRMQF